MSILPEQYSSYAGNLDNLIITITVFVVGWFAVATLALLYGVFTSLKKEGGKAEYIPGIGWDQTKWILIPLIFVVMSDFYIDIVTAKAWTLVEIEQAQPPAENHVKIIGRQFFWEFVYPGADGQLGTSDDVSVAEGNDGTLMLPINKVTHMHLTSADVLHSWFVRQFRFKQDVIPGREIVRWVKPNTEGKWEIACAEICGPLHGKMRNWVNVVSQEEFDKYINELNSGSVAMATE
jgi:cytochrome c oxidase subunit 2